AAFSLCIKAAQSEGGRLTNRSRRDKGKRPATRKAANPAIRTAVAPALAPRGSISRRPRRRVVIGSGIGAEGSAIGAGRNPVWSDRLGAGIEIAIRLRP